MPIERKRYEVDAPIRESSHIPTAISAVPAIGKAR